MKSAAERHFRNFDWGSNNDWQAYIRNIYPVPSSSQIQRIKRKWYQRNVDRNFAVDPSPSAPPRTDASQQPARNRRAADTLAILQIALFLLAPTSGYFMHFFTAAYFAALLRKQGSPTLGSDYWTQAIRDEEVQSLAFCFLFVVFDGGLVAMLPACLGAIAASAELLRTHTQIPAFLYSLCVQAHGRREGFLTWKSRFEVVFAPVLVVCAVLGRKPVLLALVYAQFLFIKHSWSEQTRATVAEIKAYYDHLRTMWKNAVMRAE